MSYHKVNVYRSHYGSFRLDTSIYNDPPGPECITLRNDDQAGSFALVIRIDGDEETVLERWRVDARGRILRAVYDVRERELEQGGRGSA